MKLKSLLLVAACFVASLSASAGELIDQENIFGADADAVGEVPGAAARVGGLKAYADQRVAAVTPRGYYVVVSTHPREWRISMNPTTLASPEAVRQVGDRMASRFREGRFRFAGINVARELAALPEPNTMSVAASHASTNTATWTGAASTERPHATAQPRAARPIAPRPAARPFVRQPSFGIAPFIFGAFILAFIAVAILARRSRRAAADRLFASYTAKERADYVARYSAHRYARQDAIVDPWAFYLLVSAIESRSNSSSDFSSNWSPSDSSSSSSSSFDSSSGSSSSSSDSSGAGGSW